ncbi:MAG: glycosyltransferase [Lacinutrix sp.]|uniref:glycosyltransferase n=1 Tax=Lacinutrix sp. TaxID=1937692 RepID=UPI0030A12F53
MLSILIPTYNFNAFPLVNEIYNQCNTIKINYEIIVIDDCSTEEKIENIKINSLKNSSYIILKQNIGRSAIRNLLSKTARFNTLLFIDSGTFPESKNFIENYILNSNNNVVVGGMTNLKTPPKKPYKLRWLYTKKRERVNNNTQRKVICSSNFLINKQIIINHPFDETIKTYGCEDVVFFENLLKEKIKINYIENPVTHDALDDSNTFINKSEQAIENLIALLNSNKINAKQYNVSLIYNKLEKYNLTGFVAFIFKKTKPLLKLNFRSSYPSIYLYDFYRLGYFCNLKQNN